MLVHQRPSSVHLPIFAEGKEDTGQLLNRNTAEYKNCPIETGTPLA